MKYLNIDNGIFVGKDAIQAMLWVLSSIYETEPVRRQVDGARMLADGLMLLLADGMAEMALVRFPADTKPEVYPVDFPEGITSNDDPAYREERDEVARRIASGDGIYVELLHQAITEEAPGYLYPEDDDEVEFWE